MILTFQHYHDVGPYVNKKVRYSNADDFKSFFALHFTINHQNIGKAQKRYINYVFS